MKLIKAVKQDMKDFKKAIIERNTKEVVKRILGCLMIIIALCWIYVSWF